MTPAMITALKPPQEQAPDREHPVVAWIAVVAIVAAILLIAWARVAVHGTDDLEAALSDEPATPEERAALSAKRDSAEEHEQVHDAVTASRWATAFSP